ncbi:hypothetical protein AAW51_1924 [Caldimonas brevitalea]|uniref:Uncharacterized protein n=1 Tax=Caldimonas brevitalea TaxID=413882 RepID=A0A0G3BPX6_9BURK|nr:hypothetical protein AAW51_1924 [Caldimonas brevitalea]
MRLRLRPSEEKRCDLMMSDTVHVHFGCIAEPGRPPVAA